MFPSQHFMFSSPFPSHDLQNLWHHGAYQYIRQGTLLNISLNLNSCHQACPIDNRPKQGQIFSNLWRNRPRFKVLFYLGTCPQLLNNQIMSRFQCVCVCVLFFFEKVNQVHLKMANVNIKNGKILLYCDFYKIIK